jgi:hypothetical protein
MRPALLLLLASATAAADPVADLRDACAAASDEARREAAFERALAIEIDPAPLKLDGGELALPFAARVTAAAGQVTLDGGDERAAAALAPAQAGAVLRAREQGKLVARLSFRLREGDGSSIDQPCTAVGGGRFLRVRVAPLAVDLLADGKPIARLLTERGAALPSAGAQPRVDLAPPSVSGASGHDADALAEAARPLQGRALDCYRAAARSGRPRTGTVALQLQISSSGAVDQATPLIDGLRDDLVRGCLAEAARNVRFPRTRHGGKVTLSLAFSLAPAR